jgi:hypothetical protein
LHLLQARNTDHSTDSRNLWMVTQSANSRSSRPEHTRAVPLRTVSHYLIHFPDGISAIPVLECRFSPRQQLYSYLSSAPTVHVTTRFLSIAPLPYQHDFFSNRRIPPSVSCLHSFVAEPALNAGLLYACLPPYQQETACVDSDIGALDRRVRDRVVDAVCSLWIVRC